MPTLDEFKITLAESVQWEAAVAPEDPLGELTAFEMALKQFCFEQNRRVHIEAGDISVDVYLNPDFTRILDELPSEIGQVARGEAIVISFPESQVDIVLEPVGTELKCITSEYGQAVSNKHFMLDKAQAVDNLRRFLHELIDLAVTHKYISSEQGNEFLSPAQ